MFAIIGIVVVIGAIIGGYLMEHGKLLALMQPAGVVIIGGAALDRHKETQNMAASDSLLAARRPAASIVAV